MKKFNQIIILTIGILISNVDCCFSKEPVSNNKLIDSLRVENLQSQLNNQNERIDIAIERENRFLSNLELFFLFVSLVLTGLGIFGIKSISDVKRDYEAKVREAKEDLEKKLVEETDRLKNENLKNINQLIAQESQISRLKVKSNLIVINPQPQGDDTYLQDILAQFNSVKLSNQFSEDNLVPTIKANIQKDSLNIVILEDSDGRWRIGSRENPRDESIVEAVSIVESLPDNVFLLYFGPGFFPDKPQQYTTKGNGDFRKIIARIAYTNSPSKLYINIIDTLRFMELIKTK